jgi:hypothetical protein
MSYVKSVTPAALGLLGKIIVSSLLVGGGVSFAQAETSTPDGVISNSTPTLKKATGDTISESAAKNKDAAPANLVGTPPIKTEEEVLEGSYTDFFDWAKQTRFHGNLRAYFFARC